MDTKSTSSTQLDHDLIALIRLPLVSIIVLRQVLYFLFGFVLSIIRTCRNLIQFKRQIEIAYLMSCHLIDAWKVKHFPGYPFTRIVFIVLGNQYFDTYGYLHNWKFEVGYGRNFILGLVTGGHITNHLPHSLWASKEAEGFGEVIY